MEIIYSKDFGILGFSKEVLSSIGQPDFIVALINKQTNALAFKGLPYKIRTLYGDDAFDVPEQVYDPDNSNYYGIQGATFIREMLSAVGIDDEYICLPTYARKDPDGDMCLVVEINEAYPIDKPDVCYLLSQKQEDEEFGEDSTTVTDHDEDDELGY